MAWEVRSHLNDELCNWRQLLVGVAAGARSSLVAVALAAAPAVVAASSVTLPAPTPLRSAPAYQTKWAEYRAMAAVHHGLAAKPLHERFVLIGDTFEELPTQLIGVSALMVKMWGGGATIVVTVSTNQTNFNLHTAAGSPSTKVRVICIINSTVEIHAGAPSAAYTTGSGWANGTTLRLVNNGYITGYGGDGGEGGFGGGDNHDGHSGYDGGNAIDLQWPLTIDNTNGYILAGGGGGGGGADWQMTGSSFAAGGGGGGGGAGNSIGSGGPGNSFGASGSNGANTITGSPPTSTIGGNGGPGGNDRGVAIAGDGNNGGDWGQPGSNGSASANHSGGTGGNPGKAVNLNGLAVTWQGGNNGTQVRGAVA